MIRSYLKISADFAIERVENISADDLIEAIKSSARLIEITNPEHPTEYIGSGEWKPLPNKRDDS